jgi:hypothetical protein
MSGQPLKNPSDAAKFRQQYLATLALQAKNDDINLQANKIFKKTGQTPAQMTDTRTTTEKVADIQRLKIEVRKELSPIADLKQAEEIVNAIDDPAELIFLAQNIIEIIKILQPKNKLGILAQPFLTFFRKYMEKQNETQGVEYGLQQSTGKDIILGIEQIQNTLITPAVLDQLRQVIKDDANLLNAGLYRNIKQNIDNLGMVLPSKDLLTAISQIQDSITKADIQSTLAATLQQLPNAQQISPLLRQLKLATSKNDVASINRLGDEINQLINTDQETKDAMDLIYQSVQSALPSAGVVNPFERAAGGTAPAPKAKSPKAAAPYLQAAKGVPTTPSSSPSGPSQLTPAGIVELEDIFIPNSQDIINKFSAYKSPSGKPKITNPEIAKLINLEYIKPIMELYKKEGYKITYPDIGMTGASSSYPITIKGLDILNKKIYDDVMSKGSVGKLGPVPVSPVSTALGSAALAGGQQAAAAAGKQAGGTQGKGMKGRGLTRKSKAIKINPEGGIKPQDEYVSLGRYFINKHKLNKNIVSVRTKTGHSAKLPVKRVSDNLSSVVRTILGGGMPTFDALEKLTDEEKLYLHKLSKQSNIIDKLSIPTPNKKELDQDINEFEIMKGQILSGNDNTEYIKKFKLLIVKLINQDVLPRNQGKDILIDLATLGY